MGASAQAQALLQEVEREQSAALAAIRDHPFVQGVANDTVSRESLQQFAHAEYWYMQGYRHHHRPPCANPQKIIPISAEWLRRLWYTSGVL